MKLIPTAELDCVGFYCPIPILRTKEEMNRLQPGDVLRVEADDPAAEADLQTWSRRTGNPILDFQKLGSIMTFYIQKA